MIPKYTAIQRAHFRNDIFPVKVAGDEKSLSSEQLK